MLLLGGDVDLYGYCINDPVNCIDPLGLANWGQIAAGLLEIGSAGLHYWMAGMLIGFAPPIGSAFGIGLGVVATAELALGLHNVWEGILHDRELDSLESSCPISPDPGEFSPDEIAEMHKRADMLATEIRYQELKREMENYHPVVLIK
jgi:hypothetical protein